MAVNVKEASSKETKILRIKPKTDLNIGLGNYLYKSINKNLLLHF